MRNRYCPSRFDVRPKPSFTAFMFPMMVALVLAGILLTSASAQSVATSQGAQQANTQSAVTAPKGTASIEGTVVTGDGERPVRKATVTLTPEVTGTISNVAAAMATMQSMKQASTDADGHFDFHELTAGSYRMMVQHPSYVSSEKNAKAILLVNVAEGQQVKDVIFRMIPGAVIKGLVDDDDGDPVSKASVQVLKRTMVRGKEQWVPAGFVLTDDLGEFRVGSLSAGKYYVAAAPMADPQVNSSGAQNTRRYVKTYYPSTLMMENASLLDVKGGDELPITIQLLKTDTYPINGTVFDANGNKAQNGMVWVSSFNDMIPTSGVPAVLKNGTFEARVPPGKYRVMAMMMGDANNLSSMTYAFETIEVTQSGAPDVKIQTAAGAKVTVRIRADGANAPKLNGAKLSLARRSDDDAADVFSRVFSSGGTGSANVDGIADLGTVTDGTYDLNWRSSGGAADDWYLKSVVVGSHDITREGLHVNGSTPLHIEAVLSGASARVEGTVTTQTARSIVVVAVPDQELRNNTSAYRVGNLDSTGKFVIRGLPPGRYTLLALENPEPQAWFDPDFLKKVENQGESVTLSENERKQQVALKPIPAPETGD